MLKKQNGSQCQVALTGIQKIKQVVRIIFMPLMMGFYFLNPGQAYGQGSKKDSLLKLVKKGKEDTVSFFNDKTVGGSLTMTSVKLG